MNTNSINSSSSAYVQQVVSALQNSGLSNKTSSNLNGAAALSGTTQPDSSSLSPLAQLMTVLQQLQQSNPGKYQQVTQQIATNLQSAAQTAQSQGNTAAADRLSQLATDFTNASQSGQMPNMQDLSQAAGAHHHHHHGHVSSGSATDSSSGSSSAGADQLLAAFQTNAIGNEAMNPMAIITNTLAAAGISASNS